MTDHAIAARTRTTLLALLVAIGLAGVTAVPATAGVDAAGELGSLAQQARSDAGLPRFARAADLDEVAARHASRMREEQRLHHNPRLADEVEGWQRVAENVGRGTSAARVHDAFMASDGHRRNLLDPDLSEIGVGIAVDGDRLWVVEVFRQPTDSPSPQQQPEAAPAPSRSSQSEPAPVSGPTPAPSASTASPTTAAATGQPVHMATATTAQRRTERAVAVTRTRLQRLVQAFLAPRRTAAALLGTVARSTAPALPRFVLPPMRIGR